MKRAFHFVRFFTPLLCAFLPAGPTLFTGCTGSLLTADEENHTPAIERRMPLAGITTSKLRHTHLLDRARRTTVGLFVNEELGENDGPSPGDVRGRSIPDGLGQGLRIKGDYEGAGRMVELSGATAAPL